MFSSTVPFRGPPRYNPRRRSGIGWLSGGGLNQNNSLGPPSPCPSDHPFSSASSSLSEGSSSHRSHEDDISIVTGISLILLFVFCLLLFLVKLTFNFIVPLFY